MGHTHEKVDQDLFATIGNLKTIKDCKIPNKFSKFVKLQTVSLQAFIPEKSSYLGLEVPFWE
jgi:hypothetical protein